MRIASISAACATVLLLAACGGGTAGDQVLFKREKFEFNEEQPVLEYGIEHVEPSPVIEVPMEGVPALDELAGLERNASDLPEDRLRYGAELAAPGMSAFATVDGDYLVMTPDWVRNATPSTSDLAWAVYSFPLSGYNVPGTLQLWWDTALPPAGDYFIGLADFGSGRWRWYNGPQSGQALDFGALSGYYSASDNLYVAVVLTGQGSYGLGQLRIGDNIQPTASFTVDQSSGTVPLTVNFDAGASMDIDGEIVSHEWDFEGDGFAAPVAEHTAQHVYAQTGNFLARLRVTDNEGGQRITETVISVSGVGGNQAPNAVISADVTTGNAPLSVAFLATGSSDPDGSITKYEWDVDGDGSFETDTGTTPAHASLYTDAGSYNATLRVTDDQGSTDTDSVLIEVSSVGAGGPPVAKLSADYAYRKADGQFNFNATGSSDPDDDIVKYEFDWDSDGNYELDNGASPLAAHTYTPGTHGTTVRVTDGGGRTDTASLSVIYDASIGYSETEANDDSGTADDLGSFAAGGNQVAGWTGNLGAGGYDGSEEDWLVFTAPQAVQVQLGLAFLDSEADIDLRLFHESDLVNHVAQSTGTGDSETINYSIPAAGTYYVRIYIYASASARGPADYTFSASASTAPVCQFTANPLSGEAPLLVSFDLSASYHPEGNAIVGYAIDPSGTGSFIDKGASPLFQHSFTGGTYNALLRVEDEYGAFGTAPVQITANVTYDETEDNDTFDTGNFLPSLDFTGWFGNIGPDGPLDGDEEDWYRIVVGSTGSRTINFYFSDSLSDLDMKLYGTDGITEIGTSTSTTDNETITYNFTQTGTYYLKTYVYVNSSPKLEQDYMLEVIPTP
ncbi:MAG: PKD domain-containing protein [bacterium]